MFYFTTTSLIIEDHLKHFIKGSFSCSSCHMMLALPSFSSTLEQKAFCNVQWAVWKAGHCCMSSFCFISHHCYKFPLMCFRGDKTTETTQEHRRLREIFLNLLTQGLIFVSSSPFVVVTDHFQLWLNTPQVTQSKSHMTTVYWGECKSSKHKFRRETEVELL